MTKDRSLQPLQVSSIALAISTIVSAATGCILVQLSDSQQIERKQSELRAAIKQSDSRRVQSAFDGLRRLSPPHAELEAARHILRDPNLSRAKAADASAMLRKASANADLKARSNGLLGELLLTYPNLSETSGEALQRLNDAASAGERRAMYVLARQAIAGQLSANPEQIVTWLDAASRSDEQAASLLIEYGRSLSAPPVVRQKEADLSRRAFQAMRLKAESGKASAMISVGDAYRTGIGVGKNLDAARDWYERALKNDSVTARIRIVSILRDNPNDPDANARAHKLMLEAAQRGNAQAFVDLGIDYFKGRGTKPDFAKSQQYFEQAVKNGSVSAKFYLGRILLEGMNGEVNEERGLQVMRDAAVAGSAQAAYYLASGYRTGRFASENKFAAAEKWLLVAAKRGLGRARAELARAYESGALGSVDEDQSIYWANAALDVGMAAPDLLLTVGQAKASGEVIAKDIDGAKALFERAVQKGSPTAMLRLGQLYFTYRDEASREMAIKWLHRAADAGQSFAWVELGRAYAAGAGVQVDPVRAVSYFRKSVEMNNTNGMCELGRTFASGYGSPRDPARAFAWYKRAAELGSIEGMLLVAQHYIDGEGVPASPTEARSWLQKAAATGDPEAEYTFAVFLIRNGDPEKEKAQSLLQSAASKKFGPAKSFLDVQAHKQEAAL